MTTARPDESDIARSRRASAGFDTVARSAGDVPAATRLNCLAAVELLRYQTEEAPLPQTLTTLEADALVRAALHELGSLPLDDFATVRAAAAHGRRALRELR